ncbi:P-II family nitrogen regulator [uncultured Dysosmobacter sp.]|uniref:P-II family nitrogen regulator n=1 Tax=uncultured Dysosmobacter sp. TaxID=2591384 RepID=UPI0026243600|nr:P-II family nitrogen regulator [uncultured Dysosmobacter sp.]
MVSPSLIVVNTNMAASCVTMICTWLRCKKPDAGKIFTCNVKNVIQVRTGEQGYDALLDDVK